MRFILFQYSRGIPLDKADGTEMLVFLEIIVFDESVPEGIDIILIFRGITFTTVYGMKNLEFPAHLAFLSRLFFTGNCFP